MAETTRTLSGVLAGVYGIGCQTSAKKSNNCTAPLNNSPRPKIETPMHIFQTQMPCSSAMTSQNLAPIWFPHLTYKSRTQGERERETETETETETDRCTLKSEYKIS